MTREELKEYYRIADNWQYERYRIALYQLQEHPWIFWVLAGFAAVGVGTAIGWAI